MAAKKTNNKMPTTKNQPLYLPFVALQFVRQWVLIAVHSLILLHTFHAFLTHSSLLHPNPLRCKRLFIGCKPLLHNFGSPAAHFGLIRVSQFLKSTHFAYKITVASIKL